MKLFRLKFTIAITTVFLSLVVFTLKAQIITTVAGNVNSSYGGDGGLATSAGINVGGVAIDHSGNIFISDEYYHVIRKVNAKGIINTIAGVLQQKGYSGDGGLATSAYLNQPEGIATDAVGNLYIADTKNDAIRKISNNAKYMTKVFFSDPGQ